MVAERPPSQPILLLPPIDPAPSYQFRPSLSRHLNPYEPIIGQALRTLDQGPGTLEPFPPLSNLAWITRQQRQLAVPIPSRPGGDVALDQTADRNRCGGDTLIGSPDGSKGAPLEQVELLAATGTGDHGSRATSRPDILRAANSVMVPQQPFFMGE